MIRVEFKNRTRIALGRFSEVSTSGQAGILGVSLSPSFKKDGCIYSTRLGPAIRGEVSTNTRSGRRVFLAPVFKCKQIKLFVNLYSEFYPRAFNWRSFGSSLPQFFRYCVQL